MNLPFRKTNLLQTNISWESESSQDEKYPEIKENNYIDAK